MGPDSSYHVLLRVSALTFALLLVFDSGVLLPVTRELSKGTQDYLANAVGATASVSPTELNVITAELTKQKQELDAREEALNERSIDVALGRGGTTESDYSTYIMSVILFILLVLITLNYALDYVRQRRLVFDTHEPQT